MVDSFVSPHLRVIKSFTRFLSVSMSCLVLNFRPIRSNSKLFTFANLYLKKCSITRYNNLSELTVVDNPNYEHRFELVVILTSVEFNSRIITQSPIVGTTMQSLIAIYPNSNWSEREVRDMFGIYFTNNSDLRRLLTDYGFEGFPLRKDFPLTGYVEARYDDYSQRVLYEPVQLAQELRLFNLNSPWEQRNC